MLSGFKTDELHASELLELPSKPHHPEIIMILIQNLNDPNLTDRFRYHLLFNILDKKYALPEIIPNIKDIRLLIDLYYQKPFKEFYWIRESLILQHILSFCKQINEPEPILDNVQRNLDLKKWLKVWNCLKRGTHAHDLYDLTVVDIIKIINTSVLSYQWLIFFVNQPLDVLIDYLSFIYNRDLLKKLYIDIKEKKERATDFNQHALAVRYLELAKSDLSKTLYNHFLTQSLQHRAAQPEFYQKNNPVSFNRSDELLYPLQQELNTPKEKTSMSLKPKDKAMLTLESNIYKERIFLILRSKEFHQISSEEMNRIINFINNSEYPLQEDRLDVLKRLTKKPVYFEKIIPHVKLNILLLLYYSCSKDELGPRSLLMRTIMNLLEHRPEPDQRHFFNNINHSDLVDFQASLQSSRLSNEFKIKLASMSEEHFFRLLNGYLKPALADVVMFMKKFKTDVFAECVKHIINRNFLKQLYFSTQTMEELVGKKNREALISRYLDLAREDLNHECSFETAVPTNKRKAPSNETVTAKKRRTEESFSSPGSSSAALFAHPSTLKPIEPVNQVELNLEKLPEQVNPVELNSEGALLDFDFLKKTVVNNIESINDPFLAWLDDLESGCKNRF